MNDNDEYGAPVQFDQAVSSERLQTRVLSAVDRPIVPSHKPRIPYKACAGHVEHLKNIVENLDLECVNAERLIGKTEFIDMMKTARLTAAKAQEEINTINSNMLGLLSHDFSLQSNTARHEISPGQIALNLATICAINAHSHNLKHDSNVLIICSGDGQDIDRFYKSKIASGEFPHFNFFLVDPVYYNKEKINGVRATYPLTNEAKRLRFIDHTLEQVMNHVEDHFYFQGKKVMFDFILCHQGVQHIAKTRGARLAIKKLCEEHLSDEGAFVGDFIDLNSLRELGQHQATADADIKLVDLDLSEKRLKKYDHGRMKVQVGRGLAKKTFKDGVVVTADLVDLFLSSRCAISVMSSRAMMKYGRTPDGKSYKPPPKLDFSGKLSFQKKDITSRVEVQAQRVMIVTRRAVPLRIPPRLRESGEWMRQNYYGAEYKMINRGRLLGLDDGLYFLTQDYVIAPKLDGKTVIVTCVGGQLEVKGPGVGAWKYSKLISAPDFVCQAEAITSVEKNEIYLLAVVVVDVTSVFGVTALEFWGRWLEWMAVYARYPDLQEAVACQCYEQLKTTVQLKECERKWKGSINLGSVVLRTDGMVFQPENGPPGTMHDGWGTARYFKWEPTVDVECVDCPGLVYEIPYSRYDSQMTYSRRDIEDYGRLRPDKKKGNSNAQIESIRRRLAFDEITELLAPRNSPLTQQHIKTIFDDVVNMRFRAAADYPVDEVAALMFRHTNDFQLRGIIRSYGDEKLVMYLRLKRQLVSHAQTFAREVMQAQLGKDWKVGRLSNADVSPVCDIVNDEDAYGGPLPDL